MRDIEALTILQPTGWAGNPRKGVTIDASYEGRTRRQSRGGQVSRETEREFNPGSAYHLQNQSFPA